MTTHPLSISPVLTTKEVQAISKQSGAADSFFATWLYEQIIGDQPLNRE